MAQSPLFLKTYDLLDWLIPLTLKFPKQQRAVLTRRLQDSAFDLQAELIAASHSAEPLSLLTKADVKLTLLRQYLRLAKDWQLLSLPQYQHASERVNEIGRLLGGWQRSCQQKANPLQRKAGADD